MKDVDAAQPPLGSQSRAGNRSRFPQPCRSGTGLWEGTPGGDGERVQGVPPGMEQGCVRGGGCVGWAPSPGTQGVCSGCRNCHRDGTGCPAVAGRALAVQCPAVGAWWGGTGGAGEPAVGLGGRLQAQSLSRSDAGVSGAFILRPRVPSSRAVRGGGAPRAAGSGAEPPQHGCVGGCAAGRQPLPCCLGLGRAGLPPGTAASVHRENVKLFILCFPSSLGQCRRGGGS